MSIHRRLWLRVKLHFAIIGRVQASDCNPPHSFPSGANPMRLPCKSLLLIALAAVGLGFGSSTRSHAAEQHPNVLFIAIDDLRDWVHYLGYEQVKTPNLDRLSQRGVTFTHAYCASPVCNPSRTALMSGQRSSTTGVYSNSIDWRPLVTLPTLNEHFRANGYYVCGAGKIYHGSYPRDKDWDDYQHEGAVDADDVDAAAKRKGNKKAKAAGSD